MQILMKRQNSELKLDEIDNIIGVIKRQDQQLNDDQFQLNGLFQEMNDLTSKIRIQKQECVKDLNTNKFEDLILSESIISKKINQILQDITTNIQEQLKQIAPISKYSIKQEDLNYKKQDDMNSQMINECLDLYYLNSGFDDHENYEQRIIFFDLETTSLYNQSKNIIPGIIQIAALDGLSNEYFCSYVKPHEKAFFDPRASQIHKISSEMLQDQKSLDVIWKQFEDWIQMLCNKKTKQTPILIAYNGKMFDFKVIRDDLKRHNMNPNENIMYCDFLLHVKHQLKPHYLQNLQGSKSLKNVYNHLFQEDIIDHHDALGDCKTLKKVYQEIQIQAGCQQQTNSSKYNIEKIIRPVILPINIMLQPIQKIRSFLNQNQI